MTKDELEKEAEEFRKAYKDELKQKFSNLYEKRKSFYEQHKDFAEQIGFSKWQKNEFFQYICAGAEFGYNKANEWHEIESKISPKREISKKYMPKSEEKVLLKYHFYDDDEVHISDGYYDAYDFQFHIANNPKHRIVCVIAWKELPEEDE